ncbi:hypothetical protein LGK95_08910 [Clostridium algoriphilum]|uniref:hypothetical protein n=1 Tax=Clostridium algoriphilum TaxID=198347 RepID=UPI001CF5DC91|nr:hypothetical protein [Clostridium algoriphilum]MCB2293642.1 hypothetical protein [Clostridium algoriphilum]
MGKVIELKKEGNTDSTEKESFEYIHQFARDFYVEEEGTSCLEEINGFEVGLFSYLINEDKGRLPSHIKNIRVEAMKAFERTTKSFSEVEGLTQEFYVGYIKGFCSCYEL